MTREEALAYNEQLKCKISEVAVDYGIDTLAGSYIVDNHITIIPDDARKGMIFLGEESVSYKPGNIKIDLKNTLVVGLELFASISNPESVFNYIQFLIVSLFFIEKAAKVKIGKIETYIVYLLHKKDIYNLGLNEETFINEVLGLCEDKEEKAIGRQSIVDAINRLYKIKAIDIKNGDIFIAETVWLKK